MDYHSDRFEDFSLMVYRDDVLFAVLPANIKETKVISHQGLTYGSFVLQESAKLFDVFEAFKAMLAFLNTEGIHQLFTTVWRQMSWSIFYISLGRN